MSGTRPQGTAPSPAVMNAAFLRAVKEDDARRRWPTSPLAFRDADEVLAFAESILTRHPADPLSDVPAHLLLGQQIGTREPPLSSAEATKLWRMLQRLNHLVTLDLEDGDGLLQDIPPNVIAAFPLSFPKLQYLSYRMMYSAVYCNRFLAALRDAPLRGLALTYPQYLDGEDDIQSLQLAVLLSHPSVSNLQSLEVINLKYELLALPSAGTVSPLLQVDVLVLDFALEGVYPRGPLVGYLLEFFPNLHELHIATKGPLSPTSEHQWPTLPEIRDANVAAQASARRPLYLAELSASLLDLLLLGVPCPEDKLRITEVDQYTAQRVNLLNNILAGAAPHRMSVAFKEDVRFDAPTNALHMFLIYLREHWNAFPHSGVPQEFRLDIRLEQLAGIEMLLDDALNLAHNSFRLEYFTLNILLACKARHGIRRRNSDSSDDSDEFPNGVPRCMESQLLLRAVQERLDARAEDLAAATANGLQHYVNVSSFCDPRWRVLARGTGASQNRVLNWLVSL